MREKGVMEIPLDHLSGRKNTRSKVCFSYTAAKGKLEPVEGQLALELPLTPLFIHEIAWTVEIPDGYEVSAAEGNVELTSGGRSNNPSVAHFTKKLCRNERPQAQIFYRKRGLE